MTRAKLTARACWLLSRLALILLALRLPGTRGDVVYYFHNLHDLHEYPAVSVWPLKILATLTDSAHVYGLLFAGFCLLLDALFCLWLARSRAWYAFGFWLLFTVSISPLMVTRMDLMPGLLVAAAGIAIGRSSRVSAALLGVATAVKLWPLALITGIVGGWRERATWVRAAWFLGALAVLADIIWLTEGIARIVSPLKYQSDRGLQSEAIVATPFMWLAHLDPGRWDVRYAASKSFEVFGAGVGGAMLLSGALSLLVGAVAAVVAIRHLLRRGVPSAEWTRAAWLALTLAIIVTAKVNSSQYLLWAAPLIAVMTALDGGKRNRLLCWLMVAAGALTTVYYPWLFGEFIANQPSIRILAVLTLRNLLVVAMLVVACTRVFSRSDRGRGAPAVDPAPRPARSPYQRSRTY